MASALMGKSATLLRSSTSNWWQRVPALVRGTATSTNRNRVPKPGLDTGRGTRDGAGWRRLAIAPDAGLGR